MSEECQVVPEESGNTVSLSSSSSNALYKYDFVLNNYKPEDCAKIREVLSKICKKWVFGYEVGESGTPHLQGFMHLIKKERITTLKSKLGSRLSFRGVRNELACIEYCKKDGNFESFGFPKPIKIIDKLYPWQQSILDIYLTEPDDRTIHWFWEPTGNVGKSAFVKYMVVKYGVLFCNGGKHSDLVNLVFNANMDDCKCIIWDLPRSTKGKISYSTLECVKNGMICNTKYETGNKIFNPPHIFCFANYPPENPDELSEDKWKVVEL